MLRVFLITTLFSHVLLMPSQQAEPAGKSSVTETARKRQFPVVSRPFYLRITNVTVDLDSDTSPGFAAYTSTDLRDTDPVQLVPGQSFVREDLDIEPRDVKKENVADLREPRNLEKLGGEDNVDPRQHIEPRDRINGPEKDLTEPRLTDVENDTDPRKHIEPRDKITYKADLTEPRQAELRDGEKNTHPILPDPIPLGINTIEPRHEEQKAGLDLSEPRSKDLGAKAVEKDSDESDEVLRSSSADNMEILLADFILRSVVPFEVLPRFPHRKKPKAASPIRRSFLDVDKPREKCRRTAERSFQQSARKAPGWQTLLKKARTTERAQKQRHLSDGDRWHKVQPSNYLAHSESAEPLDNAHSHPSDYAKPPLVPKTNFYKSESAEPLVGEPAIHHSESTAAELTMHHSESDAEPDEPSIHHSESDHAEPAEPEPAAYYSESSYPLLSGEAFNFMAETDFDIDDMQEFLSSASVDFNDDVRTIFKDLLSKAQGRNKSN